MVQGVQEFNFVDKRVGVTKENEQYISINVISKDNRKFNFISKDKKLIDKISPLNLQRFAPIKLILSFDKIYNNEKRTSYWKCELVGVE